jgi:cellulose synthase/poly-beta-1,6-N-acetylglucosamine synthase-like glycosyltransferase
MTTWLSLIYVLAAAGIALFGLLGLVTLVQYHRHRKDQFPCPPVPDEQLPMVTVQLPIFNERLVVSRLIDAVARLDYPRDRLQIQVLDDSTDDTWVIANQRVAFYRQQGLDIQVHHRSDRQGYKAGALQAGLAEARGDFMAIFDADFVPRPEFLRQTVPHFISHTRLGLVQARWGHLNSEQSALTAAQTIALDKHFAMEQTVRHRASFFPKFNGSAGIWRRTCLENAGGWESDTVCEDLCLSTRAVLRGWQFLFLNDVVAPAELPATVSAYKNQQSRWAKGSTQCLVKFGPDIVQARQHSPAARLYALLSMAGYATHLLVLILLLVQVPLLSQGFRPPGVLIGFSLVGISQPLLFILGQRTLYRDWRRRLSHFPALLLVAVGLAPSNGRAMIQAVIGRKHVFVRTPKGPIRGRQPAGLSGYRLPLDWIVGAELLLCLYAGYGLVLALEHGYYGSLPFLAVCILGFGYVGIASIWDRFGEKDRTLIPSATELPVDGNC